MKNRKILLFLILTLLMTALCAIGCGSGENAFKGDISGQYTTYYLYKEDILEKDIEKAVERAYAKNDNWDSEHTNDYDNIVIDLKSSSRMNVDGVYRETVKINGNLKGPFRDRVPYILSWEQSVDGYTYDSNSNDQAEFYIMFKEKTEEIFLVMEKEVYGKITAGKSYRYRIYLLVKK